MKFLSRLCTKASILPTRAPCPRTPEVTQTQRCPLLADAPHGALTCCIRCMHLDACTPYALFTMCGTSYLAHMAASSSSLGERAKSGQKVLAFQGSRGGRAPVGDTRGEAGSGGVNTQDVVGAQFLDLSLHGAQVRAQLVALQKVLDHHRFETCWGASVGSFERR